MYWQADGDVRVVGGRRWDVLDVEGVRACRLTLYASLAAIVVAFFWGLEYSL